MITCTFFGHRDCPGDLHGKLRQVLTDLITKHGVELFYVGNQGQFDAAVRRALRELKQEYPQMQYAVVLAYMPGEKDAWEDHSDTMLPEGIESVPRRYAISWRNNWMVKQSSYAVTYITHPWGGAAQYAQKAARLGCTVINLAPLPLSAP